MKEKGWEINVDTENKFIKQYVTSTIKSGLGQFLNFVALVQKGLLDPIRSSWMSPRPLWESGEVFHINLPAFLFL
jgi:hypothetical protein